MQVAIDIPDDLLADLDKIASARGVGLSVVAVQALRSVVASEHRDGGASEAAILAVTQRSLEKRRIAAGLDPKTGRPTIVAAPMHDIDRMVSDAATGGAMLDPGPSPKSDNHE